MTRRILETGRAQISTTQIQPPECRATSAARAKVLGVLSQKLPTKWGRWVATAQSTNTTARPNAQGLGETSPVRPESPLSFRGPAFDWPRKA